mmetsp:Transcript_259/g.705  ORF Transcript_259/g.705 Transcript_259/m.705 type:complete len:313 (+) Transcript_259:97-1035(+)
MLYSLPATSLLALLSSVSIVRSHVQQQPKQYDLQASISGAQVPEVEALGVPGSFQAEVLPGGAVNAGAAEDEARYPLLRRNDARVEPQLSPAEVLSLEKAGFDSNVATALLNVAAALDPKHARVAASGDAEAALSEEIAEALHDQAPATAAAPAAAAATPAAGAATAAAPAAAAAPGAAAPGAVAAPGAAAAPAVPVNGTATGAFVATEMVASLLAAGCCCGVCACAAFGAFYYQKQGGDLSVRPSLYSAQRAQRAAARADRSGGQTGSDRDLGVDDPSAALSDGSRSGGSRYAARRGQRSGNEAPPAERSF